MAVIRADTGVRNVSMRSITVLLAAVALVAGCGSDEDRGPKAPGTPAAAPGASAPSDGAIAIEDFKYVPEDITVEAGMEVRWSNVDTAPHTATADDGSFDTGNLGKGDSKAVTLTKPGTYAYFCEFHKFMRATITVR